jgi:hypothetical protein
MVKHRQSGEEQIPTILVSVQWIMAQPTFRLGVNDARAGRPPHPDYDLWSTNAQWNYERGRAWGVFVARSAAADRRQAQRKGCQLFPSMRRL